MKSVWFSFIFTYQIIHLPLTNLYQCDMIFWASEKKKQKNLSIFIHLNIWQTFMNAVWFSDPVIRGRTFPNRRRSSSTGHLSEDSFNIIIMMIMMIIIMMIMMIMIIIIIIIIIMIIPRLYFTDCNVAISVALVIRHASSGLRSVACSIKNWVNVLVLFVANFGQILERFSTNIGKSFGMHPPVWDPFPVA